MIRHMAAPSSSKSHIRQPEGTQYPMGKCIL